MVDGGGLIVLLLPSPVPDSLCYYRGLLPPLQSKLLIADADLAWQSIEIWFLQWESCCNT